jgi:hypothetical protein
MPRRREVIVIEDSDDDGGGSGGWEDWEGGGRASDDEDYQPAPKRGPAAAKGARSAQSQEPRARKAPKAAGEPKPPRQAEEKRTGPGGETVRCGAPRGRPCSRPRPRASGAEPLAASGRPETPDGPPGLIRPTPARRKQGAPSQKVQDRIQRALPGARLCPAASRAGEARRVG